MEIDEAGVAELRCEDVPDEAHESSRRVVDLEVARNPMARAGGDTPMSSATRAAATGSVASAGIPSSAANSAEMRTRFVMGMLYPLSGRGPS
jgi:hypothetical protein